MLAALLLRAHRQALMAVGATRQKLSLVLHAQLRRHTLNMNTRILQSPSTCAMSCCHAVSMLEAELALLGTGKTENLRLNLQTGCAQ